MFAKQSPTVILMFMTATNLPAAAQPPLTSTVTSNQYSCSESPQNYFICQKVDSSTKLKKSLSAHVKLHLKEKEKYHECRICDYKARWKHHLTSHVQKVHITSKNRICPVCNKSVKYLDQHKKLFHSGGQTTHCCNICTFKTIYYSSLKKHIFTHQTRKHVVCQE